MLVRFPRYPTYAAHLRVSQSPFRRHCVLPQARSPMANATRVPPQPYGWTQGCTASFSPLRPRRAIGAQTRAPHPESAGGVAVVVTPVPTARRAQTAPPLQAAVNSPRRLDAPARSVRAPGDAAEPNRISVARATAVIDLCRLAYRCPLHLAERPRGLGGHSPPRLLSVHSA